MKRLVARSFFMELIFGELNRLLPVSKEIE